MGHLLGQLVRLVVLRERNRVTAGGGGGTGGQGSKHLEGGRRREERRRGEGQLGIFRRGRGSRMGGMRRAGRWRSEELCDEGNKQKAEQPEPKSSPPTTSQ